MIVAGVWTGVGFSILKNCRTRIKKLWNRIGVGVWKSDSGHLWTVGLTGVCTVLMWWLLFVRAWSLLVVRSIDLLQLPGAVLLIGRAPLIYWGVSNYCALTEVFLLPRIQLCSLHRLSWLLLPYDYRHDYFLVSSMLKLSSLKPSKYTRWIFASIGRFVTLCNQNYVPPAISACMNSWNYTIIEMHTWA